MEQQAYKHYRSMDIYGNGVGYNVLIVKEDANGDVYFIKEEDLDGVDIRRMQSILSRRDAATTPLWDVMHQVTLKNGMNALEYFHQLVLVRTASGQIINPSSTRRGMRQNLSMPGQPPQQAPAAPEMEAPPRQQTQNVSEGNVPSRQEVTEKSQEAAPPKQKRGPGRPPKNKNKS